VHVRWRDAHSFDEDGVTHPWIEHDCIRETTGFFMRDTDLYLILCTDIDVDEDGAVTYGRAHKIPHVLIVYRKEYDCG